MKEERFVFISRPTIIGAQFEKSYSLFHKFLMQNKFKPRRLGGQSDYSRKAPLKAVIDIIDQCCGAIILGYPQIHFYNEIKRSAKLQNSIDYVFPTPWNQIEGALAYRAKAPILVVAHEGINGGIFDHGVTGEGVLHIDLTSKDWFKQPTFKQPFNEWRIDVEACLQQA